MSMTEWTRQEMEEEEKIFENPIKELRTAFISEKRYTEKVSDENKILLKDVNIINRQVANVEEDIELTDDSIREAFEDALLEMFLYP